MRYQLAVVAVLFASALTAGCCSDYQYPQYQSPLVQTGQPVVCIPQTQVQPQGTCPPGYVPVQYQQQY